MYGDVLKTLRKTYKNVTMLASFPGKDPFYILIATILSARNRDEQTTKVVKKLFAKFKDAKAIAKAPIPDLERLVKQSGFYKVKARRIKEVANIILELDGKVPGDIESMIKLPGVGRKTAGCVMVYAFDKPAIPVDTHVHRISNRLGWVSTKDPMDTEQELMRIVPKRYWKLVNEVFVLHGQNICNPITPKCSVCPIRKQCKRVDVKKSK